jgi:general secretion pathway protein J
MKRSRGFTLFEVLIAVSIFAVIGTIAMTSLIQVGRTGERVSFKQQQLADIQFTLGYLGRDLVQMVNRKVRDQYGDEQPQLVIGDNHIIFTRDGWSNLLQQKRSNLQRVEYRLQDDVLQRRFWPQLDQGYSEVVVDQPLLQQVQRFEVKLITTGKNKISNWPSGNQQASATAKPVALELTLEISDFGEIQRVYELVDGVF